MKGIPDLLNPIELAEKRIMAQAELVYNCIGRLNNLVDNFRTHKGFGLIKNIQRKRAKDGFKQLDELLKQGEKYKKAYLSALEKSNAEDIVKLSYLYIILLESYRDHVIIAFSYDPFTNSYRNHTGKNNWKWMTKHLIIPELKSYS